MCGYLSCKKGKTSVPTYNNVFVHKYRTICRLVYLYLGIITLTCILAELYNSNAMTIVIIDETTSNR